MSSVRFSLLVSSFFLLVSNRAVADWLTPQERDFIASFGSHVFINGVPKSASSKTSRLEEIATASPEPLRGQITGFAAARRELQEVNSDRGRPWQHFAQAVNEISPQLPRDPKARQGPEYEALYLKLLSKNPNLTKAWFAERDRLENGLRALDSEAASLTAVLDGVQKRIGRQLNPGQPFLVEVKPGVPAGGEHIWIVGKAGPGFSEGAILQILVHTPPAKGTWNAGSKFKNLNFSPLGSEFARRLQEKDTDVGAELTKFQEKAKDRPSVRTLLVPPVNAGGEMKFDLMMPGALSHYTDRIEIRSWCKAGFFMIESVPGLDGARRRTLKSEADKLLPKVDKGSAEPGGLLTASGQPDPMLQPGKARGSRPGGTPFPAPPKGLPELPKVAEVEPKDGRSLAKPKTAVDLLYPGSLWKGSYPGRLSPKGKTVTVEFAVTSRAGTPNRDVDGFVGKMKLTDDTGIAARPFTARGSITKGGEMTWQHSYVDGQGEDRREIYDYRAKLVKENVLDVQCVLEGKAVVRSFRLEYVPPR